MTLEEIKDKVAISDNFINWDALFESCAMYDYGRLERAINQVAQRYAQQYIDANKELLEEAETFRKGFEASQQVVLLTAERNKELVEMLDKVIGFINTLNPDNNSRADSLRKEITELITKHTTHEGKEGSHED